MHDAASDQPGATVCGYCIERLIGVGGAAAVYEARRVGPGAAGERVACKVLHPTQRDDPTHRKLVWREAVLGLRVTAGHPRLVELLDFFDDATERLCIVMELVDGASVAELRGPDGRLPFPVTRRLGVDVLEALAHLHGRNVLHRDLSLRNILVSAGGVAKVTDLGLAREMAQGRVDTGGIHGTPMYISPEALQRLPLDARADLFSLGAILFDLVAGVPPCGEASKIGAMLVRTAVGQFEPLPPDTPPDLAELITGLIQPDRNERRPQTAAEALDLLHRHGQPIASREELAALVAPAQSRRDAELADARPGHVLAPGHVLVRREDQHASARPPDRESAARPALAAGDALVARPALLAGDALVVQPAPAARDAVEARPAGAAEARSVRALEGALNPLHDLVAYFGADVMARLIDEIEADPEPEGAVEGSARPPDRAAESAARVHSDRAADAVPEHIDDVLPDFLASHVPAPGPAPLADAQLDHGTEVASRDLFHRRSYLAGRVVVGRAVALAIVASVLALGFLLGHRLRGERDAMERPQPPDPSAPLAGPASRAPLVPVTPGPHEPAKATAESRPTPGRADGQRDKRIEERRRARLFGPVPTPWAPVPLGGEPPPWGAP